MRTFRFCDGFLRRAAVSMNEFLLSSRVREWSPAEVPGTVFVFSPHYDDETLGAGGAILKLAESGIAVHLVFLTDGSRSHSQAMDGAALSILRREESMRAAARLGVRPERITFLEFPETRLFQHRADARERITQLLAHGDCKCVFVPARIEPLVWSSDHRVTTEIVFDSLSGTKINFLIVEYPVWFWYHWPWVPICRGEDTRQLLKLTSQNFFGAKAWMNFNASLDIEEVRLRKYEALQEYKTQMTRLATDKPWPVLSDVAQGEFLAQFFASREYFRVWAYRGQ